RERRGQGSLLAPGGPAPESSAVRESALGSTVSTVRPLCADPTLYPRILRRVLAGNFKILPVHLGWRRGFSLIERPNKLGRHQHHQLGVAPGERLAAELVLNDRYVAQPGNLGEAFNHPVVQQPADNKALAIGQFHLRIQFSRVES